MFKKGKVYIWVVFFGAAICWLYPLMLFGQHKGVLPVNQTKDKISSFPIVWNPANEELPRPDELVRPSASRSTPCLRGIKLDPADPFKWEFIVDTKDKKEVTEEELAVLIKYFLAGITVPEKDLWVNLSPYEEDEVIAEKLSVTDLGKDLLSQDYILKQLTSSFTYPESRTGREYWSETHDRIHQLTSGVNVPIDVFNKVWIVPDKAEVYENKNTVLITEASLKVLSEEDHLALEKSKLSLKEIKQGLTAQINKISQETLKRIIIPAIEKEVNRGENFTQLRQAYHSLILGAWFKKRLKDSLYRHYIDQDKVGGLDIKEAGVKEKIYSLYMESFKRGVFDFIKSDSGPISQKNIRRKYHSGGFSVLGLGNNLKIASSSITLKNSTRFFVAVLIALQLQGLPPSMPSSKKDALLPQVTAVEIVDNTAKMLKAYYSQGTIRIQPTPPGGRVDAQKVKEMGAVLLDPTADIDKILAAKKYLLKAGVQGYEYFLKATYSKDLYIQRLGIQGIIAINPERAFPRLKEIAKNSESESALSIIFRQAGEISRYVSDSELIPFLIQAWSREKSRNLPFKGRLLEDIADSLVLASRMSGVSWAEAMSGYLNQVDNEGLHWARRINALESWGPEYAAVLIESLDVVTNKDTLRNIIEVLLMIDSPQVMKALRKAIAANERSFLPYKRALDYLDKIDLYLDQIEHGKNHEKDKAFRMLSDKGGYKHAKPVGDGLPVLDACREAHSLSMLLIPLERLPRILKMLGSKDGSVRSYAARLLKNINMTAVHLVGLDLIKALNYPDDNVSEAAWEILGGRFAANSCILFSDLAGAWRNGYFSDLAMAEKVLQQLVDSSYTGKRLQALGGCKSEMTAIIESPRYSFSYKRQAAKGLIMLNDLKAIRSLEPTWKKLKESSVSASDKKFFGDIYDWIVIERSFEQQEGDYAINHVQSFPANYVDYRNSLLHILASARKFSLFKEGNELEDILVTIMLRSKLVDSYEGVADSNLKLGRNFLSVFRGRLEEKSRWKKLLKGIFGADQDIEKKLTIIYEAVMIHEMTHIALHTRGVYGGIGILNEFHEYSADVGMLTYIQEKWGQDGLDVVYEAFAYATKESIEPPEGYYFLTQHSGHNEARVAIRMILEANLHPVWRAYRQQAFEAVEAVPKKKRATIDIKGGVDFENINLQIPVGDIHFNVSLEDINKLRASSGLVFDIIRIRRGISMDSILGFRGSKESF